MLLNRASAMAALTLSLGGAVTFIDSNSWLSQSVAQNIDTPNNPNQRMPRWIGQLNLTPQQAQRMQNIQNQYKGRMEQSVRAMRQAQIELRDLMASDAASNVIRQKHRQVENLRQEVSNLRFESLLEMREVLTPAQRRQFAQNMENQRQNFPRRFPNRSR